MDEVSRDSLSALFKLRGVHQHYAQRALTVCGLDSVDFTLHRGDTCAVVGASGSGKSTLLNILGLLERPAGGQVEFFGHDVMTASPDTLAHWRNRHLGFIFQSFNLLPRLSALDNVALPLLYRNHTRDAARALAAEHLQAVGLAYRAQHRPADLSGGQRQRVAIARALVGKPTLILADEPTGNLDQHCANDILELLLRLNHDASLVQRFARRIEVTEGRLQECVEHVTV